MAGSNPAHITVHIQQSHSSSPQSHPKHGFETDLIGFLIELPELLEGSVQSIGVEIEAAPMVEEEDEIYVLCYDLTRKSNLEIEDIPSEQIRNKIGLEAGTLGD